jgi:hypothetical protein
MGLAPGISGDLSLPFEMLGRLIFTSMSTFIRAAEVIATKSKGAGPAIATEAANIIAVQFKSSPPVTSPP